MLIVVEMGFEMARGKKEAGHPPNISTSASRASQCDQQTVLKAVYLD